ncbi:MAG TPA: D-2-hydroxyacid dehydrogenase, partial [Thermomicrobiales bacterium]|nr:D-2-hydroxyacid dehydrogenase [Thermomicrobiales bacterium]
MTAPKPTIVVASPYEAEYIDVIQAAAGERVTVIYATDLLPPSTYPADHDGPDDFKRSPKDQARWLETLAKADILFGTPKEAKSDLLALCPRLRWMQGTSAGMGKPAERMGLTNTDVIVTTASGTHARPLAEFVFAAMLSWSRHLDQLRTWQEDHHWQRFTAGELAGKRLTLIGPGRIGQQIIRTAQVFGMQVSAVGRAVDPNRAAVLGVDRYEPASNLRALLPETDVLIIASPHTSETDHLIGKEEFALLPRGAWFINIGRGAVVDETELIARLLAGHIAHAALDVFAVEPLPTESPLWDMDNVIISPHCSANAPRENE